MFTPEEIHRTTAKFDEVLAKRALNHEAHNKESQAAYQSLNVIKRLSKAKFPVYLTCSKINKQNYAMKIFSFKGDKPHPYFKNEVRFACLKHPNVINIIYHELEKDTLYKGELKKVSYVLMEYAPYGDFFDFVTKHREDIDEKLVRSYFRQLISGIEYLHASKVAHLDLKPENLLVGADFNLKIADYDLSYVVGDDRILSRGTRYYRGPEFFRSQTDEPKLTNPFAADVYAAGIILFILKSGGIYPHSENNMLEGIDLVELMYNNNTEFWRKHCEIQERPAAYYDRDFKELFNEMVKCNPDERISLEEIKKSRWYNGPVYTPIELQRKMRKILRV